MTASLFRRTASGIAVLAMMLIGVVVSPPSAVASVAPVITSPQDGAALCLNAGDGLVVGGTATPGATVTVYVDGHDYRTATADDGGGWQTALVVEWVGTIDLAATQDDGSGEGPPSATVSVRIDEPVNVTIDGPYTGNVLSPANADGRFDSVDFAVISSATTGQLTYTVSDLSGTVVRHYPPVAAAPDGHQGWTWDGKDDGGNVVADGPYRARVRWSDPASACTAAAKMRVEVDDTAPSAPRTISRSYAVFYPRAKSPYLYYRTTIGFRAGGLDAAVAGKLLLYRGTSATPFRTIHGLYGDADRAMRASWNGRAHRRLMPAGTYAAQFVVWDAVGNTTDTPRLSFRLSHDHLDFRHRYVSVHGADFDVKQQDNSCGMRVRRAASSYAHGVLLDYCGHRDRDVSLVGYHVRAPKAIYLQGLKAKLYGRSPSGNRIVLTVWNWNHPRRSVNRLEGPGEGYHARGELYPVKRFIDDGRYVRVLAVFGGAGHYDYDIRDIGIQVRYAVLAA